MSKEAAPDKIEITVPAVTGEDVASAVDMVDDLVKKYGISQVDADALFGAMVTMYVRERAIRGDSPPPPLCGCGPGPDEGQN